MKDIWKGIAIAGIWLGLSIAYAYGHPPTEAAVAAGIASIFIALR
jgi:hypothetical protein